jgi:hypothetical protein
MKSFNVILVVCLIFLLGSFSTLKQDSCRRTGIKGFVVESVGNQMPSPDVPRSAPKGIKTTLYIYKLTNINDVQRQGVSAFYSSISTTLVKTVQTNDDGSFKLKLKPGKYSLFVKKGDLFYSSQFDDKNNIHPVEVTSGTMAEINFQVNYNAVY